MTQEQINCLNKASREEIGFSFMSALSQRYDILEVVHKAMQEYALLCLEKAADNMADKAPRYRQLGDTEASRYYECLKSTITTPENLA